MMKVCLNLDKTKKYLLACSYGPDSMCLFDLLLKNGYDFEIAHVNYHLRKEEPEEMKDLKKICKNFKIPLHIIDVKMPKGVNEEGWARDVRYNYFSKLGKQTNIKNILIAHNEDDYIETYFLQKKRNSVVSFYGLKKETNYKGVNIIRPLLCYKKADLLNYCDENKIHYGIDYSNFDISYLRNDIRKNIVSKMDNEERKKILNDIEKENKKISEDFEEISKFIEEPIGFFKNRVTGLSTYKLQLLLIKILEIKGIYCPISQKFVKQFKEILLKEKNWHKELKDGVYLCVDYGFVSIYELVKREYFYKINELPNTIFKLNPNAILYKNIIGEGTYIKSGLKTNEVYVLNNGVKKKIRRCFIDWKMPFIYRLMWPGIYDKNGNLIYVPHYQEKILNQSNSPLLFNLNNFIK